mmetsp:Transcript_22455/g.26018  ORF Transcript_22455/g.26018 Transcript_22455/m.26018 type:complete len:417 (-) Transcript_22455:199-1449(-)
MGDQGSISPGDWAKGIFYSILASIVGGASKLAIRKSWLMVKGSARDPDECVEEISSGELAATFQRKNSEDKDAVGRMNQSIQLRKRSGENLQDPDAEFDRAENIDVSVDGSRREEITQETKAMALCLRSSGMLGMSILNPLFCVLAMNYASPSILAPFSGLTLVWIILFSEQFIGEKPQFKQILAASLIILGQITVGVFGDHTNDEGITLEEIVQSYQELSFQMFFVGMTIWMLFLTYLMIYKPTPKLCRFAWGVSSGSITGFQNFLKDTTSIVKACESEGVGLPWYFYLMVCLSGFTAFTGLLFLMICMKRYDATFSSSMFVGSFIISASIMAAIHYDTFQHLQGLVNYIMYPAGLGILMIGLNILVQDTEEVEGQNNNTQNERNVANAPEMNAPLMLETENDSEEEEIEIRRVV